MGKGASTHRLFSRCIVVEPLPQKQEKNYYVLLRHNTFRSLPWTMRICGEKGKNIDSISPVRTAWAWSANSLVGPGTPVMDKLRNKFILQVGGAGQLVSSRKNCISEYLFELWPPWFSYKCTDPHHITLLLHFFWKWPRQHFIDNRTSDYTISFRNYDTHWSLI